MQVTLGANCLECKFALSDSYSHLRIPRLDFIMPITLGETFLGENCFECECIRMFLVC